MPLDFSRARPLLQKCELRKLFIEELGWEPTHQELRLRIDDTDFVLKAAAEKRGFTAWLCESPTGNLPVHATRLKLDRKLTETSFEHLIVFVTGDRASQSWMWVRRETGKPLAARTHEYHRGQPGDSLLQKLQSLYVSLEEEEAGLSTVEVAGRARAAFDIERITKSFYRDFDAHRKEFVKFIDGITDVADREWYASVMLNRLMFVYFIQRKGFLDSDANYLRNRLDACSKEHGKDKFYSFYRYFLLRLFHEGFGKRSKDRARELEKLIGNIPYLNGGLFDVHELEKDERYGKSIHIPDEAFESIFNYFDKYQWHLDERPLRADNEINPDVLGYIFEKYINQKQMGAYYTKEDITEYISKNTVLPFILEAARAKCKVAFENPHGTTVWDLLSENPDRYIYSAVRHGVDLELPPEISDGLDTAKPNLIERRKVWNTPAPADFALPTEIWREVVARRQRCEAVRHKLRAGEVRDVNDLITLNLDIRQFAQDVILNSEGPDLLRAVWHAIKSVTILDPTCGSGAFLFAALNILEPLYEICLDRMEAFVSDDDRLRPKSSEELALELIAAGESHSVEFKSTARWNVRESKADKVIEHVIVKTVAAFLNSDGGDLLIGVQDDGAAFGIEADLQLFNIDKRNRDSYENWLMTLLLGAYGKQHAADLKISFAQIDSKVICRVAVSPSSSAVYVNENNQDTLYIRTGNSTRALTTSEAISYHQQRFTNYTPQVKVKEHRRPSSPKKYSDFRKDIEIVSAHPNRSYFIFKSIILNNLFGVDIMEEAVEICKLRLFLKLVAQVEPDAARENLGIEPLPDIDFNIRAGNTLVGYATYDEVKHAVTSALDFDSAMERIEVKAADLQQTFDKFREIQTEGDGSVPYADKRDLMQRLKALDDELNSHLAGEFGVKVSNKKAYSKWLKSHQPFHWFVEFYGIISTGGFDVIIGNPPYVETSDIVGQYSILRSTLLETGNLYAICVEKFAQLIHGGAHMGVIVPISSVSTPRMLPLMQFVDRSFSILHISNFAVRPGKLFVGVDMNLTIVIGRRGSSVGKSELFATVYNRWREQARSSLFSTLSYATTALIVSESAIPKTGTDFSVRVLQKIRMNPSLARRRSDAPGATRVYYHSGGRYFRKCLREQLSNEYKPLSLEKGFDDAAICLLSSSLYYWFWIAFSDCYHVTKRDIDSMPVPVSILANSEFASLATRLLEDLWRHAERRGRNRSDGTQQEEVNFNVGMSKLIIDEIDSVLAKHYELSAEELDFISNFDSKYRFA